MTILRFEFKTNNCKFRKYNNSNDYNINDKRTTAYKQYREFCKKQKEIIGNFISCWTEKSTENGCTLAIQIN